MFQSMLTRRSLLALSLLLAPVAGCGDSTVEPPTDANTVNVGDNAFSPKTRTADPGATITWRWVGSSSHNVTWIGQALPNASSRSSGTHEVTMPVDPGDYDYQCTLHSGMTGTIRVE